MGCQQHVVGDRRVETESPENGLCSAVAFVRDGSADLVRCERDPGHDGDHRELAGVGLCGPWQWKDGEPPWRESGYANGAIALVLGTLIVLLEQWLG